MKTVIGYDVTNAQPQEVVYDDSLNFIGCEAYDWGYDIGDGEKFETVEQFIDFATNEGWFKKA